MSFCLHCSGILSAVYAVLIAVSRIELMYIRDPEYLIMVSTLCFSFGFIIYRLSLPAHRRFGEAFKAVFDQYRDKLLLEELSDQIDRFERNPEDGFHDLKTKGKKVWRYLRWHRVRPFGELENYTLGEWKRVIEEKNNKKIAHIEGCLKNGLFDKAENAQNTSGSVKAVARNRRRTVADRHEEGDRGAKGRQNAA